MSARVTPENHAGLLAQARAALLAAQEHVARMEPRVMAQVAPISDDPAIWSGIRRRSTARQVRKDYARTDRDLAAYRELTQAKARLESAQARVDYLVKATPVPFTDADLAAAVAVRDDSGWYRVIKVNRTTVGVDAGFPWPLNVKRAHILEVRGGAA